MKILYLRTQFWFNLKSGGSVGHTSGVVNAFSNLVEKITVIRNDFLPGINKNVEQIFIKPFYVHFLPINIQELFYSFKIIRSLKGIIQDYDHIYQRYSGYSFCGAYISKKYNKPLILEFNSSTLWTMRKWQKKRGLFISIIRWINNTFISFPIVFFLERYNLKKAKLIVVVSKVMKENLIAMGIPENKILVNPNGVDITKYNPKISGEEIKNKYGLKKYVVVGFIGTFGFWHGVVEMAQAIVLFFTKYPDMLKKVKFLLIGDGPLMPDVKNIIESSEYSSNVIFTGLIEQEKSHRYLAACDIFLSPHIPNPDGTKFFGSPTKLFEYMAMGKAIIASDLEQIGDILEHDKTAFLVPPGDITELVRAISFVINNFQHSAILGKQAFKKVINNFTWKQHCLKIIKKL